MPAVTTMHSMLLRCIVLSAVALSVGPIAASAQVAGSISGTVRDTSGGVIPGATVTATNTALGTQVTVTTNGQGFYSLPKVPVGRYELGISRAG